MAGEAGRTIMVKQSDSAQHTLTLKNEGMFRLINENYDPITWETDPRLNITEVYINNEQPGGANLTADGSFGGAFKGCSNLTKAILKNEDVIPYGTFEECNSLTCISAEECYVVDDDVDQYPCKLNMTYNSYDMDAASWYAQEKQKYPVWSTELSDSTKIDININGFNSSSTEKILPFRFFCDNKIIKNIIIDDNIDIDATGCVFSAWGYFDTFSGAIGLETLKFTKKLLPSMFLDSDETETSYCGNMFYNRYYFDEQGQPPTGADPYLSTLVVEFANNTIEEILEIENLKSQEGYCIGTLYEVPQIKCSDGKYYMVATNEDGEFEIMYESDTKMNIQWDDENFYWYKAD